MASFVDFDNNIAPDRSSAPSPFKVDEGYSEEPRSQMDSDTERDADMIVVDGIDPEIASQSSARRWLLSQPVELRAALAHELLLSLPTAAVSDIVRAANHRLHFDPTVCLPQETITHVFEYLDPKSLCSAARVSKAWKYHAYDPRLWRRLFALEGWAYERERLLGLEELAKAAKSSLPEHAEFRSQLSNRAHRSGRLSRHTETGALLESDPDGSLDLPDILLDLGPETALQPALPIATDAVMQDADTASGLNDGSSLILPKAAASLLTSDLRFDRPIINWQHLYTQRRRLERNWFQGRYTNFRLPHPDHMEEAHTQCVYTIQYSENHLVSGSRDKTVRVWDMDTQRLRLPPLKGHTGSVLCLQFDPRPEQDIIISGGSDADVIIWRFSDGTLLQRIQNAHTESVLNLRFDDRYLVTCSKDKSICVWNRKPLLPSDADYPDRSNAINARYPDHIVNTRSYVESNATPVQPLPPYTLLMTFDGHGAAVNALQIHEHEIVSASGDRKVMLWNIKTGVLIRVFQGHTKGIACIQYDGRRIVSGSSDNTVRIFDSATAAEVATLEGHRNLVRTVQAEFGDLEVSSDVLEAEARVNDHRVMEQQRRSDDYHEDATGIQAVPGPFVLGAKLPPGGGGTKWSKIVSGSYDETLIIWRRRPDGNWYIAKELRQEDALRAASNPASILAQVAQQSQRMREQLDTRAQQASQSHVPERAANVLRTQEGPNTTLSAAQQARDYALQLLQAQRFQQQHRQAVLDGRGPISQAAVQLPGSTGRSTAVIDGGNAPAGPAHQAGPTQQTAPGLATVPAPSAATQTQHHHHAHHPPRPPGAGLVAQQQISGNPQWRAEAAAAARPRPHHHHHHAHPGMAPGAPLNNRVFRLQFDARRIVCCSQEPIIVGWDFAAGDSEIEIASDFFGVPK